MVDWDAMDLDWQNAFEYYYFCLGYGYAAASSLADDEINLAYDLGFYDLY